VKTLLAIVLTLGLLAASGFAQPAITQLQNAASNSLAPLPNSPIAPGSYFSIYGTNIGPSTVTFWNPYPLPTSLGGVTSIAVTVGGTTVQAYPEFVYASQINAVLPSTTPTGTGTITVTYNGATSAAFPITVAAQSFGTFSWNEAGTGPGIMTNAVTYQNVTPFSTVKPGDYVTIWGTGLGAVPDVSTEQSGPPAQTNICTSSSCPVTVWVGGVQAQITYAGRSGYTAEDQIDFIVPTEAAVQGCYVQVAVQTGSIVGNSTSIAVDGTGPTCQDADGINYGTLPSASANVGVISLLSNYLNVSTIGLLWDNDTVSGEIATLSQYRMDAFQGFALAPSVNNCTVQPFLQYPPPKDPELSALTYLDAGPSLSITGPNGTKPVEQNCTPASTSGCGASGKGYSGLVGGATIQQLVTETNPPAPFFLNTSGWNTSAWTYGITPGTYTVTAPGGSAVGALSAQVDVSSAAASFQWTNQSITGSPISRSTGLTITWSGGDPAGFVDITAIGSTETTTFPAATSPGVLIECIAPNSLGSFTIPPYVMAALPSTVGNTTSLVPPGELLVGPASAVSVATPPSGLDALYIFYHYIQGAVAAWQ
jgi:uncharacterized protein (TIGR03437 family)